jgi:hypothetical protein
MSQQKNIELAKKGNPKAIAELINQRLNLKNIHAKVSRKNGHLEVLLLGNGLQDKKQFISFVLCGIKKLEINGLETLKISAKTGEESETVWSSIISIESKHSVAPNVQDKPLMPRSEKGNLKKNKTDFIDLVIMSFACLMSPFGAVLSGVFGESAPPLLRVLMGVTGVCVLPLLVVFLSRHDQWRAIRLIIVAALVFALARCNFFLANKQKEFSSSTVAPTSQVAPSIPLTFEEQVDLALSTPRSPNQKLVKLVPYSASTSYPGRKSNQQKEAANQKQFHQFFQSDKIYLLYTCTTNNKGFPSSRSLDSVIPQSFYTQLNSEFENSTGNYFSSDLCKNEKSTTLSSVDISVSIVDQ